MAIPYSRVLSATVESAADNCVELPAPPRGILRRMVVKQVSGITEGFEFDLYSKKSASPGCGSEDSECADDALMDPEVYQLIPTQTSGTDHEQMFDRNDAYENQDWDCERRRNTMIYMRLRPTGTGVKTFHIGYSIEGADPH